MIKSVSLFEHSPFFQEFYVNFFLKFLSTCFYFKGARSLGIVLWRSKSSPCWQVVTVSKAQALQRTGRAGREREGHCYRLLTKQVAR
jgi:hypothetical protein